MAQKVLDCKGLKCPQPILKITIEATKLHAGDVLEVIADCPSFETDVKGWAGKMNKVIQEIRVEGSAKRAIIRF